VVAAMIAERSGVLVLPTMGESNVLRLAPPLVVSDAEIARALAALDDVCALLERGAAATMLRTLGWLDARPAESRRARRDDDHERVALPPPVRRGAAARSYAFLLHYTRPEDVPTTEPALRGASHEELQSYLGSAARMPAGVVMRSPPIRSRTGDV